MTTGRHLVIMVPGKIAGHIGAKLFAARRCFKHDVLRMLPSDHNEDLKLTRLDIKEDCPRRACQSKCCARSTAGGQISSHDRIS